VKRVCLELGGNAPFIVFKSANIDQAVQVLLLIFGEMKFLFVLREQLFRNFAVPVKHV
jgi:hypothetical protein